MSYVTVVVRMPTDKEEVNKVKEALAVLQPFQTGMSLDDEMTVLDMIENHEDFEPHIAEDARKRAKEVQ